MFFYKCFIRGSSGGKINVTIFESYNTSVFVFFVVFAAARVNPCRHFFFFLQFCNVVNLQDTFFFCEGSHVETVKVLYGRKQRIRN